MTSKNPRVNVSLEADTFHMLNRLASKHHRSLSSIAQELIIEALELRENRYLCDLVDDSEQKSKGKARIPVEKIWKNLGIS